MAHAAQQTVDALQPRIVIPMHYRTEHGGLKELSTLAPFLEAMAPARTSAQPLLRVTREDLSQQPRLVERRRRSLVQRRVAGRRRRGFGHRRCPQRHTHHHWP